MRAVLYDEPASASGLYLGEIPQPAPGPDELLIRVWATALNRADILQRQGRYPPPPGSSPILGLEASGMVEAVGNACKRWKPGNKVMALLTGGGYAEYVTVPEVQAMPVPAHVELTEAAAIPEAWATAYQALFLLGRLNTETHSVLVHAGASGVGTAATILAAGMGAKVFVTTSKPKHARCLELGATVAIDYKTEDFADRVLNETAGRGVDLIVDCIGAAYFERNLRALALDGSLVLLSMMGGSRVRDVQLRQLFAKRATVHASTLRNRSVAYKQALLRALEIRFEDSNGRPVVRPIIDSVYDWAQVTLAHTRMESNLNTGKIILRVRNE